MSDEIDETEEPSVWDFLSRPMEGRVYVECREGWLAIIKDLHGKLENLAPDYTLLQVKEKFGGLRYYYHHVGFKSTISKMDEYVAAAERASIETCEVCGKAQRT